MELRALVADNLPPDKRDEYNAMYRETINIILTSSAVEVVTGDAGARFAALHEKMRRLLVQHGIIIIKERRKIRCWRFVGRRV